MKRNFTSEKGKILIFVLFGLLNVKLTNSLGIVSPPNLFKLTETNTLEPYQINPSDVKVHKEAITVPNQPDKFEYKVNYVPSERVDLVVKIKSNQEEVEKGDLLLMVDKNQEISMGQSHDLDEDIDEGDIGKIAETEIQKFGDANRIGKINMHFFNEEKWIPVEFREEIFNNLRVMNIIKYEYNGDYYLNFANQEGAMVEYDVMVERYLERLNQLLSTKLIPMYANLIDKMNEETPMHNDKMIMQSLRNKPHEDLKEDLESKLLKPYKEEITKNNLLLTTLHKYYTKELTEIIQGGQIREVLVSGLLNRRRNLCLDAAVNALNKRNNGEKITVKSPWELKSEPTSPIYIQLIMKDILIDIAGDAMIAKNLGSEEARVIRTYDEIAESTDPVDKFQVTLYHIITRINDGFKKYIEKLGVPSELALTEITERFVEAANFNKFLVKMIMENSGSALAQFIEKYTEITLERTFTDDIFFGLEKGKVEVVIPTFEKYLDLIGENMVQANHGSYINIIGEGGQQPVDLANEHVSEEQDLALDMNTPDNSQTIEDTLSSLDKESELDKQNMGSEHISEHVSEHLSNPIDDQELTTNLDDKTPINLL